jgi:periplasmic protein TonB
MFDQLLETTPHTSKRKFKAFGATVALQAVLVAGLVIIQMAMPAKLGKFELISTLYMAPPPPPPAVPTVAPPKQVRHAPPTTASVRESAPPVQPQPEPVRKETEVVAPTTIPQDIARIAESTPPSGGVGGGLPGGVQGGVAGGIAGGALGGITGSAAAPVLPPPSEPVRVGGNVKEPKLTHMEEPQYPPAAKKSRVQGVVVVEATVTAEGTVDKVKVISGSPLLADSAVQAVSHWRYEPTYLNGQAVPVILTAKITFSFSEAQK